MDKKKKIQKINWDDYFMGIALMVSKRSSCSRRQVGAVLVKGKNMFSSGYNGTPKGITNCNEGGCPRCASDTPSGQGLDDCICSHAEENAIVQAAFLGSETDGAILYTTLFPCLHCTKMIINAGVTEVVYMEQYNSNNIVANLFYKAGITLRSIHPVILKNLEAAQQTFRLRNG